MSRLKSSARPFVPAQPSAAVLLLWPPRPDRRCLGAHRIALVPAACLGRCATRRVGFANAA